MNMTRKLLNPPAFEHSHDPLAQCLAAFEQFLTVRGYAEKLARCYLLCVAHFADWLDQQWLTIEKIDESIVRRFLDEHRSDCQCSRARLVETKDLHYRAALGHFLVVLRTQGVIAEPKLTTTPVEDELRRFDAHMERVRGLAPRTRQGYISVVRDLLIEQFGEREVIIAAFQPKDIRQFLAHRNEQFRSLPSLRHVVSALRCYFQFRTFCGDAVHGLIGVLSYPANWQLASLPQALSRDEIERLLRVLDDEGPSARRSKAIVRCALDLGLRSGEIARLGLDDIDWQAGTITLRRTKSRREDVLPLPATTGEAIADYLRFERPNSPLRTVFVRRIAPNDRPIESYLVQKTIRQAYARAGLPYTRAHLLRHTLAGRLLDSGGSLKEVADVLRHCSLNTTLIYAKLDSRNLAAVALPWPGCSS